MGKTQPLLHPRSTGQGHRGEEELQIHHRPHHGASGALWPRTRDCVIDVGRSARPVEFRTSPKLLPGSGSPADPQSGPIAHIPCSVRRVRWSLPTARCQRCQQPARRVWDVTRTAIDIDLDEPVLLGVVVSVHHCRGCQRYFRAQPPFLRPDAIYTHRVVAKAVEAVYHDGLAFRRVAERLARDFWVRPSEAMIRRWCRAYAAGWDFDRDYLPWVVETFSGVLCIDEVYQGQLALLVAVDPAGASGDRLVGYQLVQGTVDQASMNNFLCRLRAAGISPAQVITDGAALYPSLLAEVWPTAAQQLCLLHESRRVTTAVNDVLKAVRRRLPTPPPATRATLGGRPRRVTSPADATDHPILRWRWRETSRAVALARVHELRRRGLSLREITRQTGLNRRTVTKWLRYETPPPDLVAAKRSCRPRLSTWSRRHPHRGRVGRRSGVCGTS